MRVKIIQTYKEIRDYKDKCGVLKYIYVFDN